MYRGDLSRLKGVIKVESGYSGGMAINRTYRTEEEKQTAIKIIDEVQWSYPDMIVTQLQMFGHFYKADDDHQDYYNLNQEAGYCRIVINPKLEKFRDLYQDKLKQ